MYICIYLPKGDNKKNHFYLGFNTFINLVKPTFPLQKLFFVSKQISYFFPLRRFLNLINLMSMNLKLINLMSMNFKLINLMSMNFKLINLMLMDFANKQISYFFPLRCFLSLMNLKLVVFFNAFWCFLVHFGAFWCFFVLLKSYRKKKIKSLKLA